MPYAQDTSVSVASSKADIEGILTKYGASQFFTGWNDNKAAVQFEMNNRRIRFTVAIPKEGDFKVYMRNTRGGERPVERTEVQAKKAADQENRRRWRALLLVVKAKLEAVESGISSFEEEFMAHIVTASGKTIGEMVIPKLDHVASTGKLPSLLPGKGETEES